MVVQSDKVQNFDEEGKQPVSSAYIPQRNMRRDTNRWAVPDVRWTILNCGGSFVQGSAGFRTCLRDEEGTIIFSTCRHLFSCQSELEAVLRTCLEGISLAL